jgi:hypothetical protein
VGKRGQFRFRQAKIGGRLVIGALQGADKTLQQLKPKLAISLYHLPEDYFKIPRYLDNLGVGYRFHLDHYTIHSAEPVMYAIAG